MSQPVILLPSNVIEILSALLQGQQVSTVLTEQNTSGYAENYSPDYQLQEKKVFLEKQRENISAQIQEIESQQASLAEQQYNSNLAASGEITPEMIALICYSINCGRVSNYAEVPSELISTVKYYLQKYQ